MDSHPRTQIYQQMVAVYRHEDRSHGRVLMAALITSNSTGVAKALNAVISLGRTLNERADDVLVFFDRHGMSNGPTDVRRAGYGGLIERVFLIDGYLSATHNRQGQDDRDESLQPIRQAN